MNEEDKAELYASMYGEEEEQEVKKSSNDFAILNLTGRSSRIQIGTEMVDIPSIQYVIAIEKVVKDQAKEIKKLYAALESTKNYLRRQAVHATAVNEKLQTQLDNKVNLRD